MPVYVSLGRFGDFTTPELIVQFMRGRGSGQVVDCGILLDSKLPGLPIGMAVLVQAAKFSLQILESKTYILVWCGHKP